MNEAPKNIWVDAFTATYDLNEPFKGEDIPYIRADLVDGLVEALEGLQEWVNGTAYDKARAALKALETNNE